MCISMYVYICVCVYISINLSIDLSMGNIIYVTEIVRIFGYHKFHASKEKKLR